MGELRILDGEWTHVWGKGVPKGPGEREVVVKEVPELTLNLMLYLYKIRLDLKH